MASPLAGARAVLVATFPDVKVATRSPNPIPHRYIRPSRAGGDRGRELDYMSLLVECYASSEADAPDPIQAERDVLEVNDALRAAANGGPWAEVWITGWKSNTITEFDDPGAPKHSRWQMLGTLYVRTY